MAEGLSIALPLSLDEKDGPYKSNMTLDEVAQQNIKMIVLTNPGERVMAPDFGVGIRNYLFEQETPFLVSEIRARIGSQVEKYAPFIKIRELNIDVDSDNGFLSVRIKYAVPAGGIVSDLTIPVSA
jgi:phage baseplate assembly protein W